MLFFDTADGGPIVIEIACRRGWQGIVGNQADTAAGRLQDVGPAGVGRRAQREIIGSRSQLQGQAFLQAGILLFQQIIRVTLYYGPS